VAALLSLPTNNSFHRRNPKARGGGGATHQLTKKKSKKIKKIKNYIIAVHLSNLQSF
jgi:hypothetical protein